MGRIYDATWGRAFAAFYDSVISGSEKAGLREMRRELLSSAQGTTIDLGAGTGANLDLYPDQVEELILCEPGPHMARRLRARVEASPRRAEVVEAPAENLPFATGSVDTAVFTLVLCTVPDPRAALAEVERVLRPQGRLLFLEHVRAERPRNARWQDRFERPWKFVADGCHCNRDTVAAIESSEMRIENLQRDRFPKAVPIVRPLVRGSAIWPG
jgi:ubiquinone/menaquinone biosynthesis C-methylase UbiE